MNSVTFTDAIITPDVSNNYSAQDFEAIPVGDANTFPIVQSEQAGAVGFSVLDIEIIVQNTYGYDDFENPALDPSNVTTYPGINVNSLDPGMPLGIATVISWVYSYGYDDLERYTVGLVIGLNLGFSYGDITLEIGRFI